MKDNDVLLKCFDCGAITIFNETDQSRDGKKCNECGGRLIPLFKVIVGIDLANGKDFTYIPPVK